MVPWWNRSEGGCSQDSPFHLRGRAKRVPCAPGCSADACSEAAFRPSAAESLKRRRADLGATPPRKRRRLGWQRHPRILIQTDSRFFDFVLRTDGETFLMTGRDPASGGHPAARQTCRNCKPPSRAQGSSSRGQRCPRPPSSSQPPRPDRLLPDPGLQLLAAKAQTPTYPDMRNLPQPRHTVQRLV